MSLWIVFNYEKVFELRVVVKGNRRTEVCATRLNALTRGLAVGMALPHTVQIKLKRQHKCIKR